MHTSQCGLFSGSSYAKKKISGIGVAELQQLLRVAKEEEEPCSGENGAALRRKKRHVSLRRETVLKYMLETMEKFSLHLSTFFLAVEYSMGSKLTARYFDRIAGVFINDVKVQGRVGLMCLLIAGSCTLRI